MYFSIPGRMETTIWLRFNYATGPNTLACITHTYIDWAEYWMGASLAGRLLATHLPSPCRISQQNNSSPSSCPHFFRPIFFPPSSKRKKKEQQANTFISCYTQSSSSFSANIGWIPFCTQFKHNIFFVPTQISSTLLPLTGRRIGKKPLIVVAVASGVYLKYRGTQFWLLQSVLLLCPAWQINVCPYKFCLHPT